jgi:uncharacterized protein
MDLAMTIVALTDIHGAYNKAEDIIRKVSGDVVIIGGDLTTVGTVEEAENALKQFQKLSKYIFCIAGNMDLPQHDVLFNRFGVSLNCKGKIMGDVGFFGVSAAPHSPLLTPYEISEEEIMHCIKSGYTYVKHCRMKILVSHAPPYGTKVDIIHSGFHVGSTAVRDFIEEEKPDIVICGHIHEGRGQDTIGKTKIVNCGQAERGCYALIEVFHENQILNKQLLE